MRQTQIDTAGAYMQPFNALTQMQRQRQAQPTMESRNNALATHGGPTVAASNALAAGGPSQAASAAVQAGGKPTANGGVNLDGVDPRLRGVIEAAMVEAGDGWRITEGMRTSERQAQLYAQGRTAPGNIVTNTLNSQHIKGNAIDVARIEGGKADWDFDQYARFNDIVQRVAQQRSVPITWGGDWKMRDGPHFQIGG